MSTTDGKGERGFLRGLQTYGDRDFSIYMRRAFAKSMGYSGDELKRPVVGIAFTHSKFNPCHRHFPELLEAIKRGVAAAGGLALEFPTISLHESTLAPNSMKFRNLMAMDTEEMIRAQPMDAVVLMGGCDKTVPAQLMGAASAGKPAIQLIGGPQMTSRYKDDRVGACTDCRKFWTQYRAGKMDKAEIEAVEGRLVTTAGTCAVMGTASHHGGHRRGARHDAAGHRRHPRRARRPPARGGGDRRARRGAGALRPDAGQDHHAGVHRERRRACCWRSAAPPTASSIWPPSPAALGVKLDLKRLNELSDTTPVLAAVKPVGNEFYMEDFFAAGGIGAVLRELKPLLQPRLHDRHRRDAGRAAGGRGRRTTSTAASSSRPPIRSSRRAASSRCSARWPPTAPSSSARPPRRRCSRRPARAVVFSSLDDLGARIDDPALDVTADDFLILQNAGPRSAAAMPEAGFLPIPKKLLAAGVKDMVRMSDARMSGTAYGTIILHIAPEAAVGGPLAWCAPATRSGCRVKERTLDLLVDDAELAKRRAATKPPASEAVRGYDKLFRETVLQAPDGCDFEFLVR